jgi:GNAT superfamily N-acetyltransferase
MIQVNHTNIYKIHKYSKHLKNLTEEDKFSRFGYHANEYNIDQLILGMCYHPHDHELWYVMINDVQVGWGHLAKNNDASWELAVSVERSHQRQGIGNQLITEMLTWAKFHHITEVFMKCTTENRAVQHLSKKNGLVVKNNSGGEIDSTIKLPPPTIAEYSGMLYKNQVENATKIGEALKECLIPSFYNHRHDNE